LQHAIEYEQRRLRKEKDIKQKRLVEIEAEKKRKKTLPLYYHRVESASDESDGKRNKVVKRSLEKLRLPGNLLGAPV